MKLQNFRRIWKSDFDPQYAKLIDQLGSVLNYSIETLYDALNNNVSLTDNVNCVVKTVPVLVNANGIPTTATTYTVQGITGAVQGTQVINAVNTTNSTIYPTGGIFISFTPTNAGTNPAVTINHVTGLPPGNTFNLTVVTYGSS